MFSGLIFYLHYYFFNSKHLETPHSTVRLLFADFSFSFKSSWHSFSGLCELLRSLLSWAECGQNQRDDSDLLQQTKAVGVGSHRRHPGETSGNRSGVQIPLYHLWQPPEKHRGDPQEMSAAVVPAQEAEAIWHLQNHPKNNLWLLHHEYNDLFFHLLVPNNRTGNTWLALPKSAQKWYATLSDLSPPSVNRRLLKQLARDPSHILFPLFEWLPQRCKLRCPDCKTQRRRATSVPWAVQLHNTQHLWHPPPPPTP